MTKTRWILIRLGGWSILFFSFVLQMINQVVPFLDESMIGLVNGLLGSVGTFCVMIGYLMLVRDEL